MGRRWHDVSVPLREGMPVWPGDPPFTFDPLSRIAQGRSYNSSLLRMCTHTGTHVDAPWHFEDTGKTLDQMDPALFFGPAYLLDIGDADEIRPADLERVTLPRLLIKTRNSNFGPEDGFHTDFVALRPDSARVIAEKQIRLVGIDYFSVAPYKEGAQTHHVLLQAEILVIEGLRLSGLSEGIYPFVVLPLPIRGADGAPARAFLELEENA